MLVFKALDDNDDGHISPEELLQGLDVRLVRVHPAAPRQIEELRDEPPAQVTE